MSDETKVQNSTNAEDNSVSQPIAKPNVIGSQSPLNIVNELIRGVAIINASRNEHNKILFSINTYEVDVTENKHCYSVFSATSPLQYECHVRCYFKDIKEKDYIEKWLCYAVALFVIHKGRLPINGLMDYDTKTISDNAITDTVIVK